ncbi:MAG: hypothetical protein VX181_15530, partial [Pseudomonadota bacterium]|nr:hypothetical protein [Pseudomonadota bacterium]
MSLYTDYLNEIATRKEQGLNPKPIDDGALVSELIAQIKDLGNEHRADSLNFFIYNTLPGTTSAAGVKAAFLKEIILGEASVEEITPTFAFELLSHMKGGPSVEVLLDLALGEDAAIAADAADADLDANDAVRSLAALLLCCLAAWLLGCVAGCLAACLRAC